MKNILRNCDNKSDHHMKIIWHTYANHAKVPNYIISSCFAYFGGPGPRPRPQSGGKGPTRARPAAASGPRPGSWAPKCENRVQIIWNDTKVMRFRSFTRFAHICRIICMLHYFHILLPGTEARVPIFILCSHALSYEVVLSCRDCSMEMPTRPGS